MAISEKIRLVRVHRPSTAEDMRSRASSDGGQSAVVSQCARWRKAFRQADVAYPAAVLAVPRAAEWIRHHGCEIYARSSEELGLAMSAGVRPKRVMFDCAGATGCAISHAAGLGVGQFIVDCRNGVAMLGACAERPQQVLIDTHSDITDRLVTLVLAEEHLELIGLYGEVDPARPDDAVLPMFNRLVDAHRQHGVLLTRAVLSLRKIRWAGPPEPLADAMDEAVEDGCALCRLPRPALTLSMDWSALTCEL